MLFPDAGPVFRDDVLPRVDISIDPTSLDAIYEEPWSYVEHQARFTFNNGDFEISLDEVGFRLRGNTSRYSQKKSFKISFNTFKPGQDFFGLEKMNLNGEHNDPSLMRSKLAWDICRELGVPASRSNHVLLYINDIFWGVYINVEQVDEEFVDLRYGNKNGNLYKCLWPADLVYRGTDPDDYRFSSGDRRAYDLRTNQERDDYSDLAFFIDVLNNTPLPERSAELEKVFNIDSYIYAIVMDVFTGNWDGPLYNKNNFYLYKNTATGKFEYIPFDLDNTFGIDWFGVSWAHRDVYNWSPSGESRPLYEKIMEVPEYRQKYTEVFRSFLESYVDSGFLKNNALRMRGMISQYISDDPFYSGSYGWDFNDFEQSFTNSLSASHVPIGLLQYISMRSESALYQLDPMSVEQGKNGVSESRFYPNPATDHIRFIGNLPESVSLFTMDGKKIRQWHSPIQADLYLNQDLNPGAYLLRQVFSTGSTKTEILILN
jgi:spore coat protein CotH